MSEDLATQAPSIRDALSEAIETVTNDAPVETTEVEPEAPEVQAQPEATAEPEKPQERPRMADGKFARKDEAPAEVTDKPVVRTKPPSTWKKEAAQKWDQVDPEIQAEIIRRELNIHEGIREYKSAAEEARMLREATKQYEPLLQQLGTSPVQVVAQLLPTANVLYTGTPEQKLYALAQTARDFGVDLAQLASLPAAQPVDPYFAQLNAKLDQLSNSVYSQQQAQQQAQMMRAQQEEAQLHTELTSFAATHPHFETVRYQMGQLIDSGLASDLEEAYGMAVFAHPELRPQMAVQQQAQAAQKAKSAAVSVRGSPTGATAPSNVADRREALRYAFSKHSR